MTDTVVTQLEQRVEEAANLRFGFVFLTETPSMCQRSLVDCRRRLDRVEQILVELTRARGTAAGKLLVADATASDQWDQAARAYRAAGSSKDYSGPRERYAEFNLAALEQLRAKRRAELVHKDIDVAVDSVRICHRGLDSCRQDLVTILRAHTVQERLEQ